MPRSPVSDGPGFGLPAASGDAARDAGATYSVEPASSTGGVSGGMMPGAVLERDLAVAHVDDDRLSGAELLVEELLGERVLHQLRRLCGGAGRAPRALSYPRSASRVLASSV